MTTTRKTLNIGKRTFSDGSRRTVYLDQEGRQFVRGRSRRLYGIWLHLPGGRWHEAAGWQTDRLLP
jgi:hypothetical protein